MILATTAAVGVAVASVGGLGVGRDECQAVARQELATQAPKPAVLRMGWMCAQGETCARAWLFDGPFAHGQGDALLGAVDQLWSERAAEPPAWLCLRSMGGSVETARALAAWTRTKGLGTCVVPLQATAIAPDRASCASACVEVWLAGQPRILHPEQRLGVHRSQVHASEACRWQNLGGLLDDAGQAYRQALAHGDWRLRWTLLRDGLRTPYRGATWLDGQELQARGLLEAVNTPPTARWHATRPEPAP